jgi:hypothetical protein
MYLDILLYVTVTFPTSNMHSIIYIVSYSLDNE